MAACCEFPEGWVAGAHAEGADVDECCEEVGDYYVGCEDLDVVVPNVCPDRVAGAVYEC